MRILSDFNFGAAARRSTAADNCTAAVALERIEPDGSPTRPFPPHLRNTGQGWSTLTVYEGGFSSVVRRAPALPTALSARSGVPVKHAAEQSSSDESPDLVRGEPPQLIAWTDYMGGMVREFDRKVTQISPVLCAAHVQYLGRGPAGYVTHCINNAHRANSGTRHQALSFKQGIVHFASTRLSQHHCDPDARRSVVDRPASTIQDSAAP